MKEFKGKFQKMGKGDRFKKFQNKSFRKTGKNLKHYDPMTIYVPNYNRHHYWFD